MHPALINLKKLHCAGEAVPSVSEPVPPVVEVNTAVLPLQHLLQLTPLAQTVLVAGQAGQLSNS